MNYLYWYKLGVHISSWGIIRCKDLHYKLTFFGLKPQETLSLIHVVTQTSKNLNPQLNISRIYGDIWGNLLLLTTFHAYLRYFYILLCSAWKLLGIYNFKNNGKAVFPEILYLCLSNFIFQISAKVQISS